MARLTIEDKWWTDPRRYRLAKLCGDIDVADVRALRAWKLAQEFWGRGYGLVPKDMFESLEDASKLLESGLASIKGDSVYIRGSSQYLSWLHESRLQASEGGKKSAITRKAKYGSAIPKNAKNAEKPRSDTEPLPNPPSNATEPSVSVSVLGSVLEELNTTQDVVVVVSDDGPTKPAKRKRRKEPSVTFQTEDELIKALPPSVKERWGRLYEQDPDFILNQVIRAFGYYHDERPEREPQTVRGWSQAISSWLSKNWAKYKQERSLSFEPGSLGSMSGIVRN